MEQKILLLEEATQPGFNRGVAAQKYGLSKAAVCKILQSRQEILRAVDRVRQPKKNIIRARNEELEEKLYDWFVQKQFVTPVSGTMLRDKAMDLSHEYNCTHFKFSNGWLSRFKNRYNLKFKEADPAQTGLKQRGFVKAGGFLAGNLIKPE